MMDYTNILQTPEQVTVSDGIFTIPNGFLVASIENAGEEGDVVLENIKGQQTTLKPGGVFEYGFTGKAKTAIKVVATGATAQIVFEI